MKEKTKDLEELTLMIIEEKGEEGIHPTRVIKKVMAFYMGDGIDISNESIEYISNYLSKLKQDGIIYEKEIDWGRKKVYCINNEALHY